MNHRFLSSLAAGAAFFLCATELAAQGDSEGVYLVSFVQLLVAPEKWEGKKIAISGHLRYGVGLYLYLTTEHAVAMDASSSLLVLDATEGTEGRLMESPCTNSFVTITGKWIQVDPGTFGVVSQVVSKKELGVTRITCWRAETKGRSSKPRK
jgi:hypothetical protein